jgi:F-type H+-transporting ATPase subunit delta
MAELATVARPYAEALYQVARQGDLAVWGQQAQALAEVAGNTEVRQFADSPKVSDEQIFEVVTQATAINLLPGVQNFLRAMIENGRLSVLPAAVEQFHALVNASSGISDAAIYSAYPIEPAQLPEVVAVLEKRFGRKLAASVSLEPELIGGIRVVVGDEVLDTSVKASLERMKAALSA